MSRIRWAFRILFAFLAALQVSAPTAAALADAAYAREARWIGIHVEDHSGGRRDHPPHRDDCPFCDYLAHRVLPSSADVPDRISGYLAQQPPPAPELPVRELVPLLPDSRAPPLA